MTVYHHVIEQQAIVQRIQMCRINRCLRRERFHWQLPIDRIQCIRIVIDIVIVRRTLAIMQMLIMDH